MSTVAAQKLSESSVKVAEAAVILREHGFITDATRMMKVARELQGLATLTLRRVQSYKKAVETI